MSEAEKFSLTLWKAHFWELGRSYLFFTQQSGVSDSWFIDPAAERRFYIGQIANIRWIIGKTREFQTKIYFCFIDYAKAFHCVDDNKLENSERDGNTRLHDLPPEKSICRSRSNS